MDVDHQALCLKQGLDRLSRELTVSTNVGRYTLLEQLGARSTISVWTAYDPHLGRKVALKLLHTQATPAHRTRLLREARALARLSHPNVVSVYDVGIVDDQPYIAMEFVNGLRINTWVQTTSPRWERILRVFRAAAAGLGAAHACDITHRNVKPSSIFVDTNDEVRVLGFSVAVDLAESIDEASSLGAVVDTHDNIVQRNQEDASSNYMAPEQLRPSDPVGPEADQFRLAISLYESLYGRLPFTNTSPADRLQAIEAGDVLAPPNETETPRWVFNAIRQALATNPSARYPSIDAFATALNESSSHHPTLRRWIPVALTLLVPAMGVGLAYQSPSSIHEPCQEAPLLWQQVWSKERQSAVRTAFLATNVPYAEPSVTNTFETIDEFGNRWQKAWRHVCEATRVQEIQPMALLDHRMDCLREQRQRLEITLDIFEDADPKLVGESAALISTLGWPEYCATAAPTNSFLSDDPQTRQEEEDQRTLLIKASTLRTAGRIIQAAELAKQVETWARRGNNTRMLGWALAEGGAARIKDVRSEAAIAQLQEAGRIAYSIGDLDTEYLAWYTLASVAENHVEDLSRRRQWGLLARSVVEKLIQSRAEQTVDYEVNQRILEIKLLFGSYDWDKAMPLAQQAVDLVTEAPDKVSMLAAARVWRSLGFVASETNRFRLAEYAYLKSLALNRSYYGIVHDRVAGTLSNLSTTYWEVGRHHDALACAKAADTIARTLYPPGHYRRIITALGVIRTQIPLGAGTEVDEILLRLRNELPAELDPYMKAFPDIFAGEVELVRGHPTPALIFFDKALDTFIAAGLQHHRSWGNLLADKCISLVALDRLDARDICEKAGAALDSQFPYPDRAVLNFHQANQTLYERLGETELAEREAKTVENIVEHLANGAAATQGLPLEVLEALEELQSMTPPD